jgi:hypothetical protein
MLHRVMSHQAHGANTSPIRPGHPPGSNRAQQPRLREDSRFALSLVLCHLTHANDSFALASQLTCFHWPPGTQRKRLLQNFNKTNPIPNHPPPGVYNPGGSRRRHLARVRLLYRRAIKAPLAEPAANREPAPRPQPALQ